ncbi:MAG: NAD(P)-dependent alcohol dehydrogenase [Opitutales bacterium]|nr:NAD(P)-dependent alcohol dehydrogenase [Opitutales bacterium]
MKAILHTRYGSPQFLRMGELPDPQPQANEILVRVHAATVNRTDCGYLLARPWIIRLFAGLFRPRSRVLGTDFAGEVIASGDQVAAFQVGDRVWGFNDNGIKSHAELLVIRESGTVVPIPEGYSYAEAAASAEGAHYAYNFISKVSLKSGDHVLVIGGTGAIGSAMIQWLRDMNVRITAVCDTRGMDAVRRLGVVDCVDYTREDFTRSTDRYDCVFDAVGKSRFGLCRHLLKPGGTYLSSELGPHGENLILPLITRFRKDGKRVRFPIPFDCRRTLLLLNEKIRKGAFKPLIDRHYPFEAIPEAFEYVLEGQKLGNVVITFDLESPDMRSDNPA